MNVSDYGLAMRSKAIGMIESGVPKKEVAKRLNVGYRSVRRWSQSNKSGVSLETKGRSGRPPILDRVSKIVIAKSRQTTPVNEENREETARKRLHYFSNYCL